MNDADDHPVPGGVEIAPGVRVPESVLRFEFVRSSGPGGQNVNKLSTKARLHVAMADLSRVLSISQLDRLATHAATHLTEAGDIVITCDESRSQSANRQACLDRLRQFIVAAWARPKVRRATKPSRSSRRRRLESKQQRSQTKQQRRFRGDE